jgi:hypothetical protein
MAGGRPPKDPSELGVNKNLLMYKKQLSDLDICEKSLELKTNKAELIRASISLLEHFYPQFIEEIILNNRECKY